MEVHLRAAIRSGIDEAEFWGLTPFQLGMRLQERARAQLEAHLYAAWFTARLAVEREPRLNPPSHYLKELLSPADPMEAEALAEAQFHQMAAAWGLEVEEAGEGE